MHKSQYPFRLQFRNRYRQQVSIPISETERNKLLAGRAILGTSGRRKIYNLIGSGAEFFRENGVLMYTEYLAYADAQVPMETTAVDRIRRLGLVQEANWLAQRDSVGCMLPRAPFRAAKYQMQETRVVLLSP